MPTLPRVRIVSTGSEITQGLYADTNAQKLSLFLFEKGLRVVGHAAAPDDPTLIRQTIQDSARGCDLLVMTGGLGPTDDDVNRDVIADVYGLGLERDEEAVSMMRERFAARGREMPERNLIQAMIPAGATVLHNHWGTAPGFVVPAAGGLPRLVALPGPSSEWQPMIEVAWSDGHIHPGGTTVVRLVHTLYVYTIPESTINQLISGIPFLGDDSEATILAHRGQIRLRLITNGDSEAEARDRLKQLRDEAVRRIGEDFIAGEGTEPLTPASVALSLLRERGRTLALAESCTGGWIAKSITDVAGSSETLLAGWVTYSNAAKTRDLAVPAELIEQHGAVSEEVVRAMAEGARQRAGSDFALSVSGVAGPGGGTPEKPVGTVWFGLAGEGRTEARAALFPGSREAVREWAVTQGLEFLRRFVLGLDLDQHRRL